MKKFLLAVLLAPVLAWANPIDDQCPQHVLRGAPVTSLQPGAYVKLTPLGAIGANTAAGTWA